jgi:hypothetical protein
MRAMLDAAGVESVECEGYIIRRATARGGVEPTTAVEKVG